jgi:hypothetical protein
MTNYAVTFYSTPAAAETAIEALATTATHKLIPYVDGNKPKFMLIVPAPNKTA